MPSDPASFYNRTRQARKVIVVDLGFLGDTVHLVPALWELKRGYPSAQLHALTSTVGAEVLRLAPCVDRIWGLDMYRETRTLRQQWQVLRAIRREGFEVAYNFSGADRTVITTALTGARWRVAHRGGRWHFYNPWLVRDWVPTQDSELIVYENRRQILRACGLPLGPVRFDLKVDEDSRAWAAGVVPAGAMHLSINASKPTKEWPLDHCAAMLRLVWNTHPGLVVVASRSAKARERERLANLAATLGDARLRLLTEAPSIPQLAALLARCRLHVGPDSGVLHLAVALNLPTVSFIRQQGAYRSFMPVGPHNRVIQAPCHCVDHRDAPCERVGRAECFEKIEPARVAALVRELLAAGPATESGRR